MRTETIVLENGNWIITSENIDTEDLPYMI